MERWRGWYRGGYSSAWTLVRFCFGLVTLEHLFRSFLWVWDCDAPCEFISLLLGSILPQFNSFFLRKQTQSNQYLPFPLLFGIYTIIYLDSVNSLNSVFDISSQFIPIIANATTRPHVGIYRFPRPDSWTRTLSSASTSGYISPLDCCNLYYCRWKRFLSAYHDRTIQRN